MCVRLLPFIHLQQLCRTFPTSILLRVALFSTGIEIHQDVIDHCHSSLRGWNSSKNATNAARSHPQIICGNGLCISATVGESIVGFDRIYIGAAIERSSLSQISKLLSPGGILVGPGEIYLEMYHGILHVLASTDVSVTHISPVCCK